MYQFWIVDGFLWLYLLIGLLIAAIGLKSIQSVYSDRTDRRLGALAVLTSPVWPVFVALMVLACVWNIGQAIIKGTKELVQIVMDKE